ncbi:hypothetical protein [Streptomyces coerulescens]|uniref:Uncharacterized protein n=1 Tax=Streptomyces coerulescens TaxID=29304 RepID=A0ABW0CKR9_STRCD
MRDCGFPLFVIRNNQGEVNAMRKYTKPAAKEVTSGTVLKVVV